MGMNYGYEPSPLTYFSTAAGPSEADMYGPPGGILNIYGDGTPIAESEHGEAHHSGKGGGSLGAVSWLERPDLGAFLVMLVGAWMIHKYVKEN